MNIQSSAIAINSPYQTLSTTVPQKSESHSMPSRNIEDPVNISSVASALQLEAGSGDSRQAVSLIKEQVESSMFGTFMKALFGDEEKPSPASDVTEESLSQLMEKNELADMAQIPDALVRIDAEA
ncbi:MAG: hypothetical protein HQL54_04180 [Magnetococcales bacterium]|nr:hypothetical protein [Magnetococcales bacterium]